LAGPGGGVEAGADLEVEWGSVFDDDKTSGSDGERDGDTDRAGGLVGRA
jgi:hypothetical protein